MSPETMVHRVCLAMFLDIEYDVQFIYSLSEIHGETG